MDDQNFNETKWEVDPSRNYYGDLEITENAEDAEIRTAWKKVRVRWHPDKNINNKDEATRRFQAAQSAFFILSRSQLRRDYDARRTTPPNRPPRPSQTRSQPDPPRSAPPREPQAAPQSASRAQTRLEREISMAASAARRRADAIKQRALELAQLNGPEIATLTERASRYARSADDCNTMYTKASLKCPRAVMININLRGEVPAKGKGPESSTDYYIWMPSDQQFRAIGAAWLRILWPEVQWTEANLPSPIFWRGSHALAWFETPEQIGLTDNSTIVHDLALV